MRCELVRKPADDVFKGIVGNYGRVTNAPHYIVFIEDSERSNSTVAAGYIGEGVILEATSLGLGTCWIGGFFRESRVLEQVHLEENESIISITPIGYISDDLNLSQRLMKSFSGNHRRKDLNKIVEGELDNIPPWMQTALNAARIAPSARNRQPWRFVIEEDAITVKSTSVRDESWISSFLDCGIAMLHLELGARIEGVNVEWEWKNKPLVATLVLKKEKDERE